MYIKYYYTVLNTLNTLNLLFYSKIIIYLSNHIIFNYENE